MTNHSSNEGTTSYSLSPLWRDVLTELRSRRVRRRLERTDRKNLVSQFSGPVMSDELAEWQSILARHDDHETEELRSVLDLVGWSPAGTTLAAGELVTVGGVRP